MVRGRRGGGEGWKWVGEGRKEHEWVEEGSNTAKGGVGRYPPALARVWGRRGGRIHTREQPADSMGLTEYHADGQVGGAWTCSQLRPENRD